MGFLKNLKQGLDAARNPPSQEQIEAGLASLTPEQRAAYDASMARVEVAEAEAQASYEQARAINDAARVLEGPAGEYLYGPALRDFDPSAPPDPGAMMRMQLSDFKTALKQTFNVGEVEQVEDPAERARVAAAERAERAAARAAFRAADAVPIEISRIATRGETQLAELLAFLGSSGHAATPERVFGVYRVPDRISQPLTPHSEKGRVVEWDVVHAGAPAAGPASEPALTSFAAEDRWVGRRVGERAVLDEDLGIAHLRAAGIGPEQSFGLARYCEFRSLRSGHEDEGIRTLVRGLVSVHPAGDGGTYERMRAAAPIALEPDPSDYVEVLDWAEVGRVVHPKINHPTSVPSPFAYLPSTPQELLRAYLEVVGVSPADCWSAQATVDRPRELRQGGMMTTNLGPKQPCADGEERMRSHGCEIVVVAYRDSPEYAAGRERWGRYQTEVLQARLARGDGKRRRIASEADDLEGVPTGLKTIVRAAGVVDRIMDIGEWGSEDVVPYRYCSPPVA